MAVVPKYQVFISSTYEDLEDERNEVIRAVLEMGHIPVGMEMFSAADEEQWKIIARHIDESDYYAVVIAHRLGSVTDEGISYTRKEYEYALEKGIPCLGFVIDDDASWPANRVDTNTSQTKPLAEFKELVKQKPVSFWSNADDLHAKFSVSLMKSITASPRVGWIRSSESGASYSAELLRLSAENAELRKQLVDTQRAANLEEKAELKRILRALRGTERTVNYRYTPGGEWEEATVNLLAIFGYLASEMTVEDTVAELASTLAMNIRDDHDKPWDIVAINQMRQVLADLLTLDLAHPSTRRHPVSDQNEYWSLSTRGLDILKLMREVQLNEHPLDEPSAEPDDDEAAEGRKGANAIAPSEAEPPQPEV